MPTIDILNSHPVSYLKREISKTNIKGYSKMKKNEIVELMMKNKDRFHHIKKREKSDSLKAPSKKKEEPKKLVIINETPRMLWMAKVRRGFNETRVNKFLGLPENTSEKSRFEYISKLISVMKKDGYETKNYEKDYLVFMKDKANSNVKKMVKYVLTH